ncbi:MAG: FAD-dependent monooxygenase [Rhodobacteraceae bacterium]|nr:FAD-dependent monooxygenase [Paracoccaceae bacterium]
MRQTDIVVVGGGLAGLTAAALFGSRGFEVCCCDLRGESEPGISDNRVTALLGQSIRTFRDAGLWHRIERFAVPLSRLRIALAAPGIDAGARTTEFDAGMIGASEFGFAVPNREWRHALADVLGSLANVRMLSGIGARSAQPRLTETIVSLSNGARIRSRLVVAADGSRSALREQAGISTRRFDPGQNALSFDLTHEIPHCDSTLEIHRSGGPFTLVPLPGDENSHASAAIWIENSVNSTRLAKLSDHDFTQAVQERSLGLYGKLELRNGRKIWPVSVQVAERLSGDRMALIGEAAHVVPPIGAQGLNMTIADISTLLELAVGDSDLGGCEMLASYNRRRMRRILPVIAAVTALNLTSMPGGKFCASSRQAGLTLIHGIPALRDRVIGIGMGGTFP